MQKVLIVTYYWPPGSGAGVQRWLKFSKYLSGYGWEPVILTVEPDSATYPALDFTLQEEIPDNLMVHKTKARDYFRLYNRDKSRVPSSGFASEKGNGFLNKLSRILRGNIFIPDPRRGWNRFAVKKASELIEKHGIRNIITTSPPHSTQLIGLRLKKRYPDLNWICDLRDPWTDIYYYNEFYPSWFARKIDKGLEKKVLESASQIITVGNSLRDLFATKIPSRKDKITVISNGYDDSDFSGLKSSVPEIFTITYTGTLSPMYPLKGLLEALNGLSKAKTDFRLRFRGFVSEEQKALLQSTPFAVNTEYLPYSDHSTAIATMLSSTILLLIIPDHKSSRSIITGKIFEYLASGKPVLCLGPVDGDASRIIDETGHGKTFDYCDSEGILAYLNSIGKDHPVFEEASVSSYSRINLTKKVAELFV